MYVSLISLSNAAAAVSIHPSIHLGVNHPTTVALVVPNYAQLASMWYQKLAKPIAAPFPGVDELNDPSKTHLELFDAPEFKQLISDEVRVYVCVCVWCVYECVCSVIAYTPCFNHSD